MYAFRWRSLHLHRFIIIIVIGQSRYGGKRSTSAITYYASTYTAHSPFSRTYQKCEKKKILRERRRRKKQPTNSEAKTSPGGIGDSIESYSPLHVLSFYSNSFLLYICINSVLCPARCLVSALICLWCDGGGGVFINAVSVSVCRCGSVCIRQCLCHLPFTVYSSHT